MNNRKFRIWNVARIKRNIFEGLSMGRTLVLLMLGSLLFFLLLGLGGMAEKELNRSPASSMKGLAASLSSRFFIEMIGMELPHMALEKETSTLSAGKVTPFVFELLTSVNPRDPKSLLAGELPGMKKNEPVQLHSGSGNEQNEAPDDYRPNPETTADPQGTTGKATPPSGSEGKSDTGEPSQDPAKTGSGVTDPGSTSKDGQPETSKGKKAILIYHSHPEESFNPMLGKESSNPGSSSPSKNVIKVGSWMAKRFEEKGIGAVHDQSNYKSTIPDYNWNYSYKYSRQTVKAAMAQNEKLNYFIDIHRDSKGHSKTTATVNGVNYARVYFIIGHANKNWRQNEEFASKINQKLEKSYPGISRGVWGKSADQGNGEYNQSLSPNSILIEIGGIDSTEEELKRTAELLADIMSDLYWQEQKAQKASVMKENGAKTDRVGQKSSKG